MTHPHCPLPVSPASLSLCQELQEYPSSQVPVGSGGKAGYNLLGSRFLPLYCFVYLWSPWLTSGAYGHASTPNTSSPSL